MKVLVMPDKYIKACDGSDASIADTVSCDLVPIETALSGVYNTDAHFAPYFVDGADTMPRLKRGSLARLSEMGTPLMFGLGLLDVDAPDHDQGATDEWRADIENKISAFEQDQNVAFTVYHTRGGCRVLWRLPAPVEKDDYLAMLAAARTCARDHSRS